MIPRGRMKATKATKKGSGGDHIVPLSEPALRILRKLYEARRNEYVFPSAGRKGDRSPVINKNACLWLLEKMGYQKAM